MKTCRPVVIARLRAVCGGAALLLAAPHASAQAVPKAFPTPASVVIGTVRLTTVLVYWKMPYPVPEDVPFVSEAPARGVQPYDGLSDFVSAVARTGRGFAVAPGATLLLTQDRPTVFDFTEKMPVQRTGRFLTFETVGETITVVPHLKPDGTVDIDLTRQDTEADAAPWRELGPPHTTAKSLHIGGLYHDGDTQMLPMFPTSSDPVVYTFATVTLLPMTQTSDDKAGSPSR